MEHNFPKIKGPGYLFIDGVLYDVTDYINKHPGGGIIRTMLWTKDDPLDASQAFGQFHFRTMLHSDRVKNLLKAMPLAPQDLQEEARNELVYNVRKDPRRQRSIDMLKDYNEVTEKLKRDGYYDMSIQYVISKWTLTIILFILGVWLCKNFHWFPGALFLTLVSQNLFFFSVHECGHKSFTTHYYLDRISQFICFDLFYGASARFWNFVHNHHHANTQHKIYDVDLHVYPLIYFSRDLIKRIGEQRQAGWWTINQSFTWWVSVVLIQPISQFWHHAQYNLFKKKYEYFLLGFVVHYYFHYFLLHKLGGLSVPISFIVMHIYLYGGGAAIFIQSWFSHSYTGVHDGCVTEIERFNQKEQQEVQNTVPRYHYNWVELGAYHTVDAYPSYLAVLFSGVTTCQLEHHLWPSIPECYHVELKTITKEFLNRNGLPYNEQGWWDCFLSVWTNLAYVAKDSLYIMPKEVGQFK